MAKPFSLALISLLSLTLWPGLPHQAKTLPHDQQSKTEANAEIKRPTSPSPNQATSTTQALSTPNANANAQNDQKDSKEGFSSPSWVMVYLTAMYVIVSIFAFKAIQHQSAIAKLAADATKETAEATAKSVALAYNIERPWVLASIGQELQERVTAGVGYYAHLCTIKNVGKTPAWVLSWTAKAKDIGTDILTPEPIYGEVTDFSPPVLPPNESLSRSIAWLPERFEEAHRDERFLYVFGFVSYRDLFGECHETRFCFRYYPPFRENRAQGFHVGGPPEYNKQT